MKVIDWLNKHPILVFQIPVLIVIIIISFFSLATTPFQTVGVGTGGIDFNLLHFLAYFGLSFLLGIALRHSDSKHPYLNAILITLFFSILMEGFQYFIPARSFDLMDIVYNFSGVLLGQAFRFVLKQNKVLNKII